MLNYYSPIARSFVVLLLSGTAFLIAGWYGSHEPANVAVTQAGEPVRQKDEDKSSDQGHIGAPKVTLMEGERPHSEDVMIYTQSKLIEEGDAIKRIAENEANLNNVRFNINGFQVGYSIATGKSNDRTIFDGPTKAWRATAMGEVSRWPPVLYNAARKETIRQAKLINPVPVAESFDEMNNLRLYHRPLLIGHEGGKYQEEPTALAFFVHPKTGTRMTVAFRDGRSYGAVGEPIAASAKVFVKEVVPGRSREGSRLVPSVFYFKEFTIEAEPLPKESKFDKWLQAVLEARDDRPLRADEFKGLFSEMARRTGGETEPVARAATTQSAK